MNILNQGRRNVELCLCKQKIFLLTSWQCYHTTVLSHLHCHHSIVAGNHNSVTSLSSQCQIFWWIPLQSLVFASSGKIKIDYPSHYDGLELFCPLSSQLFIELLKPNHCIVVCCLSFQEGFFLFSFSDSNRFICKK